MKLDCVSKTVQNKDKEFLALLSRMHIGTSLTLRDRRIQSMIVDKSIMPVWNNVSVMINRSMNAKVKNEVE